MNAAGRDNVKTIRRVRRFRNYLNAIVVAIAYAASPNIQVGFPRQIVALRSQESTIRTKEEKR